ncbi:MAG: hypothetical protein NTX72_05680 [Candidatus Uhrbacteria bacterium]|nr:hypothetical protein [Candidatus Uhrbacteria bacterium]
MADKSERGRGPIHIRDIIPEVLRDLKARREAYLATERLKHLERRCVPKPKAEDSVPS